MKFTGSYKKKSALFFFYHFAEIFHGISAKLKLKLTGYNLAWKPDLTMQFILWLCS